MSDNILKSNPGGIRSYRQSLKEAQSSLEDLLKEVSQEFGKTREHLLDKRKQLESRIEDYEDRVRSLMSQMSRAESDEERNALQNEIWNLKQKIRRMQESRQEIARYERKFPEQMERIQKEGAAAQGKFSVGERVIEAYLALIEQHEAG